MADVRQPSTFVTVVAWIFIALSGLGALFGILQNILVRTVVRGGEFGHLLQAAPSEPGFPAVAVFVFEHMQWIFLGALLANLVTLVVSIGLLKRLNWARLGFIALMVLTVLWQVVGLGIQAIIFSSIHAEFSVASQQGVPEMGWFLAVIGVVSVSFALVFGALFGWIAWRLMSQPIAAEFQR